MASRAATSIATRRHLPFLYRRLQASNFCYMKRDPEAKGSKKTRDAEAVMGKKIREPKAVKGKKMREPEAVKGKKMREPDYMKMIEPDSMKIREPDSMKMREPEAMKDYEIIREPGGPEAVKEAVKCTKKMREKEALPPLCIDGKFRKPETEAGKIIMGAPPRSIDPYSVWKFQSRFLPRGYDAVPYVHLAMINTRKDLKFSPKSKPNPDVFIPYVIILLHIQSERTAPSNRNITYMPPILCAGEAVTSVVLIVTVYSTSTTLMLGITFYGTLRRIEKMKGISRSEVLDCAMWCDDDQDNCKVLLVVEDNVDDIDLDPVFNESGELVGEYGDRSTFHLELYSSKTNSWSILDSSIDFSIIPNFLPGTCLDGVYHCGAHSSKGEMCILLFDFANETTSTMPLTVGCSSMDELRLVEYKGLPSVLISKLMEPIPSTYYHYVWDNGNWSYNYRLCTCGVQRPICFSRDGQVLYFESLNDELVMLNLTTEETKRLGVYCSSKPIGLYGAS